MRLTARVPATSANLGSGFDCLGLALSLYNEFTLDTDGPPGIAIEGEGAAPSSIPVGSAGARRMVLPRDERNLVYRTIRQFFDDLERPLPPFRLEVKNEIPLTGGLGSSSSALIGALLLANGLAGHPLDLHQLLARAARREGHPDNVAPALLGGFVVAVLVDDAVTTVQLPIPESLRAVLFIPNFVIPTREARRALPTRVPLRDAVFNLSRAALWVAALQAGRLDLLATAAEDRLHQPYRQALFPTMPRFLAAAREAGALASWLSGAGSAILALVEDQASSVADAFESLAVEEGVPGRVRIVDIDRRGAICTPIP